MLRLRKSMRYTQPKIYKYIPTIVTVAICVVFSLLIAMMWTTAETKEPPEEPVPPLQEEQAPPQEPEEAEEPVPLQEEEETPQEEEDQAFTGSFVEESPRVDSSYFDDAVFIGDSVTDGIKAYGLMSNTTVLANKGLNPSTMLTDAKIKTDSGYVTVLQALEAIQPPPKKVYIMQGANGIAWFDIPTMMNLYGQLIDRVKELCPDSVIYLQSILPVTSSYSDAENGITNNKINEYNNAIAQLAEEKQVYFLNVAQALKDENGALPEEASPTDGMHFGPTYYTKWFDYLKTHTVSVESN